jgi:uncharacterized protein YbaR (Trm112 family)
MVIAQDGKCAICQQSRVLCLDHSHANNAVRGLLCRSCNRLLGVVDDNPELLENAARYLRTANTGLLVNPRIVRLRQLCNFT